LEHPLTPALTGEEFPSNTNVVAGKVKVGAMLAGDIARKNQRILGEEYQHVATEDQDASATAAAGDQGGEQESTQLYEESKLSAADLPKCPKCQGMMRPDVVWFGETLPLDVVMDVNSFFLAPEPVDLCLVIGTSSQVWPAAGYAARARRKGARVAVVNAHADDANKDIDPEKDWVFVGDAATIVPELLRPVIGDSKLW
jgi:hypothetical protein